MYYITIMMLIGIEWDEAKNILNKQEHGVGFEDAQYIFTDPERIERFGLYPVKFTQLSDFP